MIGRYAMACTVVDFLAISKPLPPIGRSALAFGAKRGTVGTPLGLTNGWLNAVRTIGRRNVA
jgi:hypothetical protein